MVGLAGVTVLALAMFLVAERRAAEPVMPLRLFRNRTFATTSLVGAITAFAMFGSVTYMPVYLQVVTGASPTGSGLLLVPMMGGMLTSSILSGQTISRTGRYKAFPIAGAVVMALGLFLLSRLGPETTRTTAGSFMLVLGLGMGMIMQVLVLAVQNDVPHRDVGVATSGATLFRFIGGSVGTAVLGAVFAQRLAVNLERFVPGGGVSARGINLQAIAGLPAAQRPGVARAFAASIDSIFAIAFSVALAAVVVAMLVPEKPLRTAVAARAADVGDEMGEPFVMALDEHAEESRDASRSP
jgi:hypothetical protein